LEEKISNLNSDCVIKTNLGDIRGFTTDGVNSFLGVPYAENLSSTDRFCPSNPIQCWPGILEATQNGPIPPQKPSRLARVMGDFSAPYNENCLTLNIWSPATNKEKLPVIFWIHGGAFVSGAGSLDWYNGHSFARNQEIILVGINYRLGALGFLCHPDISVGNLGIQDQILALEWVNQNIESFGGDPANVTVMGQSAGAISAYALIANTKARNFISNVIFQSGRFNSFETTDIASEKAEKLAKIAGVTVKELKTLPLEEILNTQSTLAKNEAIFASTNIPFLPVIDGDIIPTNIHTAALEGAVDKSIMLGSTQDEMHAFISGNQEIEKASQQQIKDVFKRELGDTWETTLKDCQRNVPSATPMELISMGLNVANFEGQTATLASEFGKKGINTWVYRFDWKSPNSPFGACHCIELPFLFNTFDHWLPPMIVGLNVKEGMDLSRALQKTWATFARSGNPNHEKLPNWPKFCEKQKSKMLWNNTIKVIKASS
jgi:para-nitrobenzyl esterase